LYFVPVMLVNQVSHTVTSENMETQVTRRFHCAASAALASVAMRRQLCLSFLSFPASVAAPPAIKLYPTPSDLARRSCNFPVMSGCVFYLRFDPVGRDTDNIIFSPFTLTMVIVVFISCSTVCRTLSKLRSAFS